MTYTMNIGDFCELSNDEMILIDGDGKGALLLSCIGIAVSPVIISLQPVVGLGLLGSSIDMFANNL